MNGAETEGTEFGEFVSGFAATAASILSQVEALLERDSEDAGAEQGDDGEDGSGGQEPDPEEVEEQIRAGLSSVNRLIATLSMLEGKTKGNLTEEESSQLQSVLTELRFRYLHVNKRATERHGEGGSA